MLLGRFMMVAVAGWTGVVAAQPVTRPAPPPGAGRAFYVPKGSRPVAFSKGPIVHWKDGKVRKATGSPAADPSVRGSLPPPPPLNAIPHAPGQVGTPPNATVVRPGIPASRPAARPLRKPRR